MPELSSPNGLVCFGAFEVDVRAGELRKHRIRIKLQDQPFRVLQILLEHPGEAVSRAELQRQIWPSDTFVDFERGLNNAVRRLREALGDSADAPRYVETLAKHEAQSEGWAFTRNLVFLVSAKDGISARQVRDEGEVLDLLGPHTSTCFFTPFFVNWKTCNCVGTENTASRRGVNGTEVVQSGTNVPYSRDEGSEVKNQHSDCHRKSFVHRESPRLSTIGLQANNIGFLFLRRRHE